MKIKKSFNVLALVPARIGSKRIPHKNIKNLCGKPLIAWTIDAAKKSKYVDKIIVSTDDKEIARISKNYGAEIPFIRPYRISKDDSKSIDVVIHALSNLQKFDWLLFLQPTSPLRRKIDIDNIFKFCFKHQASSAVSVYKLNSHDLKKSNNPKLIYNIDKKFRLTSQNKSYFKKNSDKNLFCLNGAIFLAKTDWIMKTKTFIDKDTIGFKMPKKRSVDIDIFEDWVHVEKIIKETDR